MNEYGIPLYILLRRSTLVPVIRNSPPTSNVKTITRFKMADLNLRLFSTPHNKATTNEYTNRKSHIPKSHQAMSPEKADKFNPIKNYFTLFSEIKFSIFHSYSFFC